jgi:hypothetical protein
MDGETYIGDGLYASFDGYQIQLRADDGSGNVVYLEPAVWDSLKRFVDDVPNRP